MPYSPLIATKRHTKEIRFCRVRVKSGRVQAILPDRQLEWRDVGFGSLVTAALFTIGKSLIGWYLGSSAIASSYGAAGGLIILLLWVYYSVQTFLLGAEFTKVYASRHGSKKSVDLGSSKRRDAIGN